MEPPVCSVCGKSKTGMILLPTPDYQGLPQDASELHKEAVMVYWCADCVHQRIDQLEAMVQTLKGGPLIRAIESALGFHFSVNGNLWYVPDPEDSENAHPAVPDSADRSEQMRAGLEKALAMWKEQQAGRAEQLLKAWVDNVEGQEIAEEARKFIYSDN